jgi:hypothetical protein
LNDVERANRSSELLLIIDEFDRNTPKIFATSVLLLIEPMSRRQFQSSVTEPLKYKDFRRNRRTGLSPQNRRALLAWSLPGSPITAGSACCCRKCHGIADHQNLQTAFVFERFVGRPLFSIGLFASNL